MSYDEKTYHNMTTYSYNKNRLPTVSNYTDSRLASSGTFRHVQANNNSEPHSFVDEDDSRLASSGTFRHVQANNNSEPHSFVDEDESRLASSGTFRHVQANNNNNKAIITTEPSSLSNSQIRSMYSTNNIGNSFVDEDESRLASSGTFRHVQANNNNNKAIITTEPSSLSNSQIRSMYSTNNIGNSFVDEDESRLASSGTFRHVQANNNNNKAIITTEPSSLSNSQIRSMYSTNNNGSQHRYFEEHGKTGQKEQVARSGKLYNTVKQRNVPKRPANKNSFDTLCELVSGNMNYLQNGVDLKNILAHVDVTKMNLFDVAVESLKCTHEANVTSAVILTLVAKVLEVKSAKPLAPRLNVLVDGYTIAEKSISLTADKCVIHTPRAYRNVNVKASVRQMISTRSPFSCRPASAELALIVKSCLRQYFTCEKDMNVRYNPLRKSKNKDRQLIDDVFATRLIRILVSFIMVRPTNAADGIVVPPPDYTVWEGIIGGILKDALQNTPTGRKSHGFGPFSDEEYLLHVQGDTENPVDYVLRKDADEEEEPENEQGIREEQEDGEEVDHQNM